MLEYLICPHCRGELAAQPSGTQCGHCQAVYPYRQGVLSFLPEERSPSPSPFASKQEKAWAASAGLRERIRKSTLLAFFNRLRIRVSMSGRRDRIFHRELGRARPGARILDIGCGGGRHYLSQYGEVIGIDPVLDLLQQARSIYKEVYHASALELPFADRTFDYVVSSDVIGHIALPVKDQLFAEMYRVLKPGGRTIHVIETDGTNWWMRFAHRYPELFQLYLVDIPGHIGLELADEVCSRFRKAGFKQLQCKKYAGAIQECGALAATFDNEFKGKSGVMRGVVGIDRLLSRNLLVKELCNLLLEPIAQLVDACTPLEQANGLRVVFQRPGNDKA